MLYTSATLQTHGIHKMKRGGDSGRASYCFVEVNNVTPPAKFWMVDRGTSHIAPLLQRSVHSSTRTTNEQRTSPLSSFAAGSSRSRATRRQILLPRIPHLARKNVAEVLFRLAFRLLAQESPPRPLSASRISPPLALCFPKRSNPPRPRDDKTTSFVAAAFNNEPDRGAHVRSHEAIITT